MCCYTLCWSVPGSECGLRQNLIERDIQDVAQVDQLSQAPQLLSIAAELSGQLVNLSHVGGQIGLNSKTVDKYLGILETFFLVRRLPAWSRNQLGRLIKARKIHFLDAGLQSKLTRLTPELASTQRTRFGATLETWVYGELLKSLSIMPETRLLSHYRDKNQVEVDFVLESPLREIVGKQFMTGIVLCDGTHALSFGDGLEAVPLDQP